MKLPHGTPRFFLCGPDPLLLLDPLCLFFRTSLCLRGLLELGLRDTPLQMARFPLALLQRCDVRARPHQMRGHPVLVPHQCAACLAPTHSVAVLGRSILDHELRDCLARERLDFAPDALVIFRRDIEPSEPLELAPIDVVVNGDCEQVDVCFPERELDMFVQHPLLRRLAGLDFAAPSAPAANCIPLR